MWCVFSGMVVGCVSKLCVRNVGCVTNVSAGNGRWEC